MVAFLLSERDLPEVPFPCSFSLWCMSSGICTCSRDQPDDFNRYVYFFVRLYFTCLGFQANIVEECVLLSALRHIFAPTRRLQRVRLFQRSLVLYMPWIPGEHRREICAVECVALHTFAGLKRTRDQKLSSDDLMRYVNFFVRLYFTGLGFQANVVEECVLLSALRHTSSHQPDDFADAEHGYFYTLHWYCTGLGFQANIIEEYVLLSALRHIFAGLKRTRDQKLSSGLMSCQLSSAITGLHLFQFRFDDT